MAIKIRFVFSRGQELAYLSHLDLLRLFQRALRRSKLQVAYSRGYNPRLRFNLALPLPLGVTAEREFGEIHLSVSVGPPFFIQTLSAQLPAGLKILSAEEVAEDSPPLASLVVAASYEAVLQVDPPGSADDAERIREATGRLLQAEEILVTRKGKDRKVGHANIRPYLYDLELAVGKGGVPVVSMLVKAGSEGGAAPALLLQKLAENSGTAPGAELHWSVKRVAVYYKSEGVLKPLTEGM